VAHARTARKPTCGARAQDLAATPVWFGTTREFPKRKVSKTGSSLGIQNSNGTVLVFHLENEPDNFSFL
jgi:hypothetical protein